MASAQSDRVPVARATIVLVACLVILVELERLVGAALSPSGLSRSLSGLLGPAALWQRQSWDVWVASPATDVVVRVLLAHLLVDLLFIVAYAWLLRRWVRFLGTARTVLLSAGALVLFDVVEDVVLLLAATQLANGSIPGLFATLLAGFSTAKWLAVASLVVTSWVSMRRRFDSGQDDVPPMRRLRDAASGAARAVAYQRLSLLVVLLVGVLSVVPGPNIWDQLPDVQRRWVDASPADLVHMGLALLGVPVLFGQLFVLGRRRSERAWATYADGAVPAGRTPWWLWAAWPALAVVTAVLLVATGRRDSVDAVPLALFLGTYATLVGLSLALRHSRFAPPRVDARPSDEAHARRVWVAGDVLAGAVIVLAGLGMVRSFTAPLVLEPLAPGSGTLSEAVADGALLGWGRWVLQLVLWTLGLVAAVAAPSVVRWVAGRLDDGDPPSDDETTWRPALRRLLCPRRVGGLAPTGAQRALPVAVWSVAVAVLLVFALVPLQVAPAVGVVFTLQAVLGGWVVVVGFAMVRFQESQPLEVFRLLRLRATPLITLLVLVPLLASQRGGDADLHAVRQVEADRGAVSGPLDRPDVAGMLARWVSASAACDRPAPGAGGGPAVRPVLLVAAAGGGIRAATWTADVLQVLGSSACGRVAPMMSSGVSGGSVGLALGREAEPAAAAGDLSSPDALATAIAGLFVGDLMAGTTGTRVPVLGSGGRWLDRAGLIETTWERQAPGLADRFDADAGGIGGALLLNSTAAGPGCRVLVSQVDVGSADDEGVVSAADPLYPDPSLATTGTDDVPNCRVRSGQPPATLDIQDVYDECTPDISWATAAMLSARFPTLTPAGRIPAPERRLADGSTLDCSGLAERAPLQLVDGGYAEGSGLGTLADVAPTVMAAVREHNAEALEGSGDPLLVPVVVLLANSPRLDLAVPTPALSSELLVPLAGLGAASLQTDDITWLQRLSRQVTAACPEPAASACTAALDDVNEPLTDGIVVVAPQTEPAVDAPLGWTLSVDSRVRLADAVEVQADPSCVDRPRPGGYACLGQLLEVLR